MLNVNFRCMSQAYSEKIYILGVSKINRNRNPVLILTFMTNYNAIGILLKIKNVGYSLT